MPDASSGIAMTDLRTCLASRDLQGFVVPRFDAHQGEYIAPHDERLWFVTGFSGTAGAAIVTAEETAIFVDGRYCVQAHAECCDPRITHHHLFDAPPEEWIAAHAQEGWRIGYDPMHLSATWLHRLARGAARAKATLVPVDPNPVDQVWHNQPAPPTGRITRFPHQFAGRSSEDKRAALLDQMATVRADLLVETQPDNIAWFLNVRGNDAAFIPAPHSYLTVSASGRVTWFVDTDKFADDVQESLLANTEIQPMTCFVTALAEQVHKGQRVLIDPDFSPAAARAAVTEAGAVVVEQRGLLTLAKTVKNPTELEGMRACHLPDGIALTEFLAWLSSEVPARATESNPVTEREAEARLQAFRKACPEYLGDSFNTISAAGGNAAMCHYATSPARNASILPDGCYLIDSGGQYDTGTTDITRCLVFDAPSEAYRRAYTAVFKGFHSLMTLRFPRGTQGHHIDAFARRPLWDLGLDYDHGTGHGIGHRLSVHEHPQRIGKPYNPVDLLPGMVMSLEPGFYLPDRFGIRIENLAVIAETDDGFLVFQNLSLAPIQTDALIVEHLTLVELDWLNRYHAEVGQRLSAHLSGPALTWLEEAIRPI